MKENDRTAKRTGMGSIFILTRRSTLENEDLTSSMAEAKKLGLMAPIIMDSISMGRSMAMAALHEQMGRSMTGSFTTTILKDMALSIGQMGRSMLGSEGTT